VHPLCPPLQFRADPVDFGSRELKIEFSGEVRRLAPSRAAAQQSARRRPSTTAARSHQIDYQRPRSIPFLRSNRHITVNQAIAKLFAKEPLFFLYITNIPFHLLELLQFSPDFLV
jgi:hypothetical protein